MKKTLLIIGTIIAFWVGYEQITDKNATKIENTEKRNRDIEKEQERKLIELENRYNYKVQELQSKIDANDIKNVVNETQDDFSKQLELKKREYEKLSQENIELHEEISIKTDSINRLITQNQELIERIKNQEDIIAQKDSIISFYKQEILNLRSQTKEIFVLLKEATKNETEADNSLGFWNRKNRQAKYYNAFLIYKKLWKVYGLLSAEDSLHSTWKKLQEMGVELENQ